MAPRSTAAQIKEDCRELSHRLTAFEEAWEVVKLSCADLLINLAMAQSTSVSVTLSLVFPMANNPAQMVPAVFDSHTRSAQRVYSPLIECMRAYSQNRSPDL